jgi:hypothetical protein
MNTPSDTDTLEDRQSILEEIHALLAATGGIDEARAKKVRKAVEALRNADDPPAAAEEATLEAQIAAGLDRLRTRIHRQVERRNRAYDKALGQMDVLESALKANELQAAERAHGTVLSIMGNIPGLSDQRWQDIEQRLQRVRPRLRKLESWRHWGTTQARQELTAQMQQLIGADLPPEKLAKRIQEARDQWHAWDKSGDKASEELWTAFDRACEEAYRPCSAHFEQLRQQRADNLRQRRAIIDRLNQRCAATDWKHPDWRAIDKFIAQARREFYRTGNVDFKHRKPVARALDEAIGKFEEHLSRERARSLRAREKLIADIEALASVEDLREALERLEALKKQWQVTVTGKRELENKLWKRFQAACDLTWQRRDAERKSQAAERDANLRQKQALIDELAATAGGADEELLAGAATLARLQDRWQAIGWVPRKQEDALNKRWRAAQRQFSTALRAAEARARGAELDRLAARAALCTRWEQALLAGEAPDADHARTEWSALPALADADTARAMERRFAQALRRPDDGTLAANLAAKRAACLRLEVILELDSPPDCQAERMAYQVERLNASMKKELDAQDSPDDLLQAVLTTGAVPADAAAALEQRIAQCLARYREQS